MMEEHLEELGEHAVDVLAGMAGEAISGRVHDEEWRPRRTRSESMAVATWASSQKMNVESLGRLQ